MHTFQCSNCLNYLEAEYAHIGEVVECPICGSPQIVPDAVIPQNTRFNGYEVANLLRADLLWSTYLAYNLSETNKKVILKIPSTFFIKNVSDIHAFSKSLIEVHQSGITGVPVLIDHSLQSGNMFFIFEYSDITHRISVFSETSRIKPHTAIRVLLQVSNTLKALNDKFKMIHCNISPNTIRLRKLDESVLMTEMGFSTQLLGDDNLLQKGFSVWSPEYMAPELLNQGNANSTSVDFYSLGCLLYFMLTGKHPTPLNQTERVTPLLGPVDASNIPDPVISLCNDLTAIASSERPDSWLTVIERLEHVLPFVDKPAPVVEYRNKFNLWGVYKKTPASPSTQKGLVPGQNAKKLHLHKKNAIQRHAQTDRKLKRPSDTLAKIAPQHRMGDTINRNWPSRRRIKPAPGDRFVPVVIAAIIIIPLLALVLFFAYFSKTYGNIEKQPNIDKKSETTLKQPTTEAPAPIPTTTIKKNKIKVIPKIIRSKTTRPPQISDMKSKMAEIAEFHAAHPDDFDGILKKYHILERNAQSVNSISLVNAIAAKIADVETEKSVKIEEAMADIRDKVSDWTSRGAFGKAIQYLLRYKGVYTMETKRERITLLQRIENRGKKQTGKLPPNSKEIDLIFNLLDKLAKSILDNKLDDTKQELNKALSDPNLALAKNILRPLIRDINYFQKIKKNVIGTYREDFGKTVLLSLKNGRKVRVRITALTPYKLVCEDSNNKQSKFSFTYDDLATSEIISRITKLGKDTLLLKGLVYKQRGEYDNAMEVLSGIDYGLGNPFMMDMFDIKTLAKLNEILAEFNLHRYDGKNANPLFLELSRRQISVKSATELHEQIKNLIDQDASPDFMDNHGHVCDALLLYATRRMNTPTLTDEDTMEKGKKIITVKHPDDLITELQEAPPYSTIKLPKGAYTLPDKPPLTLTQWGLNIIGDPGSVINGKLVISGKSVTFNRVSFNGGILKIAKDADNTKVNDCDFNKTNVICEHVINVTFTNSFMASLEIINCQQVEIDHCTIADYGFSGVHGAPLSIVGTGMIFSNSIVYGKTYAIWIDNTASVITDPEIRRRLGDYQQSQKYKFRYFAKHRIFNKCILYGENGLVSADDGKIAKKSSQIKKFCKIKSCLFTPPIFANPRNGQWNIIKGATGAAKKSKPPLGVDWSKR